VQIDAILFAVNNPAEFEAMRREGQARINALFAVHEAKQRAHREAMWARDAALAAARPETVKGEN
jgi:propanediol dehydratase small subunit